MLGIDVDQVLTDTKLDYLKSNGVEIIGVYLNTPYAVNPTISQNYVDLIKSKGLIPFYIYAPDQSSKLTSTPNEGNDAISQLSAIGITDGVLAYDIEYSSSLGNYNLASRGSDFYNLVQSHGFKGLIYCPKILWSYFGEKNMDVWRSGSVLFNAEVTWTEIEDNLGSPNCQFATSVQLPNFSVTVDVDNFDPTLFQPKTVTTEPVPVDTVTTPTETSTPTAPTVTTTVVENGPPADLAANAICVGMARGNGGYYLGYSNGSVKAFGGAKHYGDASGIHLDKPINGICGTENKGGYYLTAEDGGVFTYGDAIFYGSGV